MPIKIFRNRNIEDIEDSVNQFLSSDYRVVEDQYRYTGEYHAVMIYYVIVSHI
jgi:hypothetical protein